MSKKLATILLSALLLSGCATTTRRDESYESYLGKVSKQLTAMGQASIARYIFGQWRPIPDTVNSITLPLEQEQALHSSLDACISELSKTAPGSVNDAMAAGQLVDCMRTRGWAYTVGEIFITS